MNINMNYEDMVRTCWEETHGRGKGKGTIHHQVWHSSPCDIKAAFVTIYVCSTCRHFYIHVAYIFCTFLIFVVFAEMNQVHSGAMRSNQIQSYKSMTYSRCWMGKHPSRWHRGIRPRRASTSSVVPTGSTSSAVASLSGKEAGWRGAERDGVMNVGIGGERDGKNFLIWAKGGEFGSFHYNNYLLYVRNFAEEDIIVWTATTRGRAENCSP